MPSCQELAPCETAVPDFVHEEIVPQLVAVMVTVPPAAGNEVGEAATLQTAPPLVEQLMVMFPTESTIGAWQLDAAVPFTVTVKP